MSNEESNDATDGVKMATDGVSRDDLSGNTKAALDRIRISLFQRFETYRHNVIAARLLAKIGYRYLSDLPKSLPQSERDAFEATLRRSIEVGLQWAQTSEKEWVGVSPIASLDDDGSAADIFELVLAYKNERANKRFVRHVALEQCVVNTFAQLDALLQDVVEIIATIEPRTLSSSRQITHADVLRQGDWTSLLHHISQKFLSEFGRENLKKRLEILEERFGLQFEVDSAQLTNVLVGEQTRHLFTHTGGVVSIDFLRQTNLKDYQVGDKIEISVNYCNHLTDTLLHIGSLLWKAIETKYLPKPEAHANEKPDEAGFHAFASNAGTTYRVVKSDPEKKAE